MTYSVDTYAVFGNPIEHSKSPLIHAQFARQCGHSLEYTAILAPLDDFAGAVEGFYAKGGKGCNVTIPFKQEAYALCAELSERARRAGAVNTLWRNAAGGYVGDNTDGEGLVNDLMRNRACALHAKRILVLGAGGAVRGVLGPLLEQEPAGLLIANRTVEKARQLLEIFQSERLYACGYDELHGQRFDVIINGTSAGLRGALPPLPDGILEQGGTAYDMVYSDQTTTFEQWGWEQGAGISVDGLGMLVEQAAAAFYLWRGVRPNTAPVIERLRGTKE